MTTPDSYVQNTPSLFSVSLASSYSGTTCRQDSMSTIATKINPESRPTKRFSSSGLSSNSSADNQRCKLRPALPSRMFKYRTTRPLKGHSVSTDTSSSNELTEYIPKLFVQKLCPTTDSALDPWPNNVYETVDGDTYYHVINTEAQYVTKEALSLSETAKSFIQYMNFLESRIKECREVLMKNIGQKEKNAAMNLVVCLAKGKEESSKTTNTQEGWYYYIVLHSDNDPDPRVFWLKFFKKQSRHRDDVQLRYRLLSEYWTHCGQFPQVVPAAFDWTHHIEDITGTLMLLLVERTTVKPRAPFPRNDLQQLISIISCAKETHKATKDTAINSDLTEGRATQRDVKRLRSGLHPHMISAIARINVVLMDWRFHTRVKSDLPDRTIWFILCSTLLFYAPDRHLEELQRAHPADFVFEGSWSEFILKWEKPWTDFILYATVLLAVNLSYLAVPNVIPNSDTLQVTHTVPWSTLVADTGNIASLCSIILSIGCILLGLLLVNEHHSDPKTEDEPIQYLKRFYDREDGYQQLAVLYSLPYALLMWSMISFLISVAFICFDSDLVQQIITAIVGAIIFVLVLWEVKVHWKPITRSNGDLPPSTGAYLPGKLASEWLAIDSERMASEWLDNDSEKMANDSEKMVNDYNTPNIV